MSDQPSYSFDPYSAAMDKQALERENERLREELARKNAAQSNPGEQPGFADRMKSFFKRDKNTSAFSDADLHSKATKAEEPAAQAPSGPSFFGDMKNAAAQKTKSTGSFLGKAALLYITAPVSIPYYGVPMLWRNRGAVLSRIPSFWGAVGIGLLGVAGLVTARSLADNHNNKHASLTDSFLSNGSYIVHKNVLRDGGELAAETVVPCTNDFSDCAGNLAARTGNWLADTAISVGSATGSVWWKSTKSFYAFNYNAVVPKSYEIKNDFFKAQNYLPLAEGRKIASTPNPASTRVLYCQIDNSDGVLRNAAPENGKLMQEFYSVMDQKLQEEKRDPSTPIGRAIRHAQKSGEDITLIWPRQDDWLNAYQAGRADGTTPNLAEFKNLARSASPSDQNDIFNFKVIVAPRAKCPEGNYMKLSSYTEHLLADFMKPSQK